MLMETKEPEKFKLALSRWKEKQNLPGRLFFEVESYKEQDGELVCTLMVTYAQENPT